MKFPYFSKKKKSDASSDSSSFSSFSLSSSRSSSREKDASHSWKFPLKFSLRSGSASNQTAGASSASTKSFSEQQRDALVAPFNRTEELSQAFRYFDVNGDGKISATELGCVLHSLGIESTVKELEEMVNDVDFDGDGFIDLEEFINLNRRAMDAIEVEDGAGNWGDDMRAAFHVFDYDGNGFISADELHRVLSGLGEREVTIDDCRSMINSVDRNGDGRVDFAEFQCMMLDTRVF